MKKGILKKRLTISLAVTALGLSFAGAGFAVKHAYNAGKASKSKDDLIHSYARSEEYLEKVETKIDEYYIQFTRGEISGMQFDKNVKNLSNDSFIEKSIFEGEDEDLKNQLKSLNAQYSKENNRAGTSMIGGAASGLLIAGIGGYVTRNFEDPKKEIQL